MQMARYVEALERYRGGRLSSVEAAETAGDQRAAFPPAARPLRSGEGGRPDRPAARVRLRSAAQ
jgi:hypothetical protein